LGKGTWTGGQKGKSCGGERQERSLSVAKRKKGRLMDFKGDLGRCRVPQRVRLFVRKSSRRVGRDD